MAVLYGESEVPRSFWTALVLPVGIYRVRETFLESIIGVIVFVASYLRETRAISLISIHHIAPLGFDRIWYSKTRG